MKIKHFICIIALLTATWSCSKMNDLHDKYLEGEDIYAAKVDAVVTHPGKDRIQLDLVVRSQRIQLIRIYWDDYNDSIDVAINNQTGVFTKMIETGLDESSHIFILVSFDAFGNKSLPYEAAETVYGDTYIKGLLDRSIRSVQSDGTNAVVVWGTADIAKGAKFTELRYTNAAGVKTVVKTSTEDPQTTIALTNYKSGTPLEYRTAYIPAETAIDTFYTTTWQEYALGNYFPLSKTTWKVDAFSSNHGGDNVVAHAIDGDNTNRWHSQDPGPHYISVSLNLTPDVPVNIVRFGIWPSVFDTSNGEADERMPTEIRFEVSLDNVTWTSAGEFTYDNSTTNLAGRFYDIAPIAAKYFKISAVDPTVTPMVLGELDIFVK